MSHDPFGHSWAKHGREGWTVCTLCGVVRNAERPESPCRGPVKIGLRRPDGTDPCDCPTPAHCLEATGGEQSLERELYLVGVELDKFDGETDDIPHHRRVGALRRVLETTKLDLKAAVKDVDTLRAAAAENKRDDVLELALWELEAERTILAKLRGELERSKQETALVCAELAEVRHELAEAGRRVLDGARDRLATIIDEHLGPQEVLSLDDILTRLEHLLHERGRQHEAALRALEESTHEYFLIGHDLEVSRDERAWLVAAVRVLATQVEWGTDTMDAVDLARALLAEVDP